MRKSNTDNIWLKAAVLGSIWAAFEITAGSFLHNIRFPFAGAILSMASTFLLLSFASVWGGRGMFIRSGIICALIKSISPSAIILGPMVGIFMEAFIIESVLFILGRNPVSAFIAGALAVSWTLAQKLINLIILYGFDLVSIFKALYAYFIKQTGLAYIEPSRLLAIIFGMYFMVGGMVGLSGSLVGKKYKHAQPRHQPEGMSGFDLTGSSPLHSGVGGSPLFYLILLIAWIISNLFFIHKGWLVLASLSGLGFAIFCILRYKQSVRHLKRWGLWAQFIVITLVATLLWEWINKGTFFSMEGLRAGLEMNYRALIILFGFSGISAELRSPVIRSMLFRKGLVKLHSTLNLSFAALPSIINSLPKPGRSLRKPQSALAQIFVTAEQLLPYFAQRSLPRQNIFIVCGEIGQGKTGYVLELRKFLLANSYQMQGFISKGEFSQGEKKAYLLCNIDSGEETYLCSIEKNDGWIRFKRFYFNPKAIEMGNSIIEKAMLSSVPIVLIDEIGPFEMQQQGWYPAINKHVEAPVIQVWVVRKKLVESVVREWNILSTNVVDISTTGVNKFGNILLERLKSQEEHEKPLGKE